MANLPSLPSGWCWSDCNKFSELVTKGTSPNWQGFDYQESGVLFVRSQNIRWGAVSIAEPVFLDPAFNEHHKSSIIRRGDVLINLVGASIGRCAVAPKEFDGANLNQAVGIVRPCTNICSDFLMFAFLSPLCQSYIHGTKADSARANFNLDDLRRMPVPVAPPDEQREITSIVTSLLKTSTLLAGYYSKAHDCVDALDQSILAKAFRGELVPQDPNDESSSALRESPPTQTPPTRTRKPR